MHDYFIIENMYTLENKKQMLIEKCMPYSQRKTLEMHTDCQLKTGADRYTTATSNGTNRLQTKPGWAGWEPECQDNDSHLPRLFTPTRAIYIYLVLSHTNLFRPSHQLP